MWVRTGPHPFAPLSSVKPSWVVSSGSAGGGAQPSLSCLLGVGGVRLELRCGVLGGLPTPCLVILDTAPPAGNIQATGVGAPKKDHLPRGTWSRAPLCVCSSAASSEFCPGCTVHFLSPLNFTHPASSTVNVLIPPYQPLGSSLAPSPLSLQVPGNMAEQRPPGSSTFPC